MCQLAAPTKLVVTFETEGAGAFVAEELEDIVVRDKHGHVVALRLPQKSVIISNHQVLMITVLRVSTLKRA